MHADAGGARSWRSLGLALSLALGALVMLPTAHAQQPVIALPRAVPTSPGGVRVPSPQYFNTLPIYHDGQYRDSLRSFRNLSGNAIKTSKGQWIDSIAYFALAGESYYQMGQLNSALEQYNSALKLFVAYSDWMMRVDFRPIRPAANPVRFTPWGQSKRRAAVGDFEESYLMGQGFLDASEVGRTGGTIQGAIKFPVFVSEIVRTTCLAIRRRRELMGPVCQHDPLTKNVLDVLTRRPGPANHWSEAWINVQLGCAYAAAGSLPQAKTALQSALLAGGQFDHPLTSTAMVELSRLALEAGDFSAAKSYAEEATYVCANFPDPANMEEAFRLGLAAHLQLNQKRFYGPLAEAIQWSKVQGPRHLNASLLLLAAEDMSNLSDPGQAENYLNTARLVMARSELGNGRMGARMNHLSALAAYQRDNRAAGNRALAQALAFQKRGSLWMFQIGLADSQYLAGNIRPRPATQLYDAVLRDPTPTDWKTKPLECLSVLTTPHEKPFVHWFDLVSKNSKQKEVALEIADRVRRHRFFSTLPAGGRILALRWLLEGPVELLGDRGLLERQDLLARYPKYGQLTEQAAQIRGRLAVGPVVADTPKAQKQQADLLGKLAGISQAQEAILREIALRREPAEMVFPPLRKIEDVQRKLAEGQVLLAFFAAEQNLHAFLFSRDRYTSWRVRSPASLKRQIGLLLREMGNYNANHELTPAELPKTNWRNAATKVTRMLLAGSNVDLAGNFDEITIVPDGFLWYLPFEVLGVGPPGKERLLVSQARVRYAPTVGLAVPYSRVQKPRPNIGVALGRLHPQDDDSVAVGAFSQLASAVDGAVALPRALPARSGVYRVLLDGLIVLDDIERADSPYGWAPLQFNRGKDSAPLASWFDLPWGGPANLILPGFHTAAETGLRKGSGSGEEVFLAVCGLMSSGARTVLISRWRAGGQTCFDLVREFAQELPHASPAEAWQRSVQLAAETPIEPDREPRVKNSRGRQNTSKAGHPFFWAGYMLVDSGALADDGVLGMPAGAAPPRAQPANPPVGQLGPKSVVGDRVGGSPNARAGTPPASRTGSKGGGR